MKKFIIPALAVSVLSLASAIVVFQNKNYQEVSAYSIANLPTTIDLNDCTDAEIRSYYAGLDSLSESERKGTNLLKNLKPILSNNQKYYSYDSNTKIWQIYEIADRDWEKSPASSITKGTYDPSTNTITGYQYSTNSTYQSGNNPYVHALYNNRDLDNQAKAWGNHEQDGWGINQEHIWAKSHGFDTKGSDGTGGARGDPMHLWAGNGWANHEHSNNFFAFVDKTKDYSDAGTKYQTAYGNLTGYSKNAGGNEKVFEPQDSDKGDIARAIFYMVARYNNYAGATEGIDGNNPNLVMLNDFSQNNTTGTSTASKSFGMGLLSDLLAWNKLDPVDEYEVHRNNLLYKNYTNNRNPFIDFPEWAEYIWGTANYDGTGYNSTPKGAAKPATDVIGQAGDTFEVSIEDIKFSVGETIKVSGKNADADIAWSVDDNSVVSIDKTSTVNDEEVTITALKNGTTTIRASAYTGGDLINKTISVTVSDLIIESISVSGMKTEFKVGEEFSTEGLKVKVNYKNGTSEESTTGFTISKPDMSKEGEQTVTVTYKDISTSYKINIAKAPIPQYIFYIAIIGGGLLLIILIIVFVSSSKKTKKKMLKAAKKGAKAYKKSKK
ncbi:MAG: endonuclease [Bacilli bacterium]|nr:endonuclease [Bacilli bacterium]